MRYVTELHGPLPDAEIRLNGEPVSYCYVADEELGFVRCFQQDDSGERFLVYDHNGPEVARVDYKGHVEIRCSPEQREMIELVNAARQDVAV